MFMIQGVTEVTCDIQTPYTEVPLRLPHNPIFFSGGGLVLVC